MLTCSAVHPSSDMQAVPCYQLPRATACLARGDTPCYRMHRIQPVSLQLALRYVTPSLHALSVGEVSSATRAHAQVRILYDEGHRFSCWLDVPTDAIEWHTVGEADAGALPPQSACYAAPPAAAAAHRVAAGAAPPTAAGAGAAALAALAPGGKSLNRCVRH